MFEDVEVVKKVKKIRVVNVTNGWHQQCGCHRREWR